MTDSTRPPSPTPEDDFEIVDERKVDYYMIDNEINDHYARRIGPYAFMVYTMLVRWSYSKPNVRQSLTELETWTGFSRTTVIKAIGILTSEEIKLVRRDHRQDEHGNPICNLYRLLRVPKKHHQEPEPGKDGRDGGKDHKESKETKENNNKPSAPPARPTPPVSVPPAPAPAARAQVTGVQPESGTHVGRQPVLIDTDAQIVQRMLVKQGVSVANARRFVSPDPDRKVVPRPEDYAGSQLDWLREQIACLYDRAKVVGNPGILLTRAIEGGYALPPVYLQRKAEAKARQARRAFQGQPNAPLRQLAEASPDADRIKDSAIAQARAKTRPWATPPIPPETPDGQKGAAL